VSPSGHACSSASVSGAPDSKKAGNKSKDTLGVLLASFFGVLEDFGVTADSVRGKSGIGHATSMLGDDTLFNGGANSDSAGSSSGTKWIKVFLTLIVDFTDLEPVMSSWSSKLSQLKDANEEVNEFVFVGPIAVPC
jgi:hypothetical protein